MSRINGVQSPSASLPAMDPAEVLAMLSANQRSPRFNDDLATGVSSAGDSIAKAITASYAIRAARIQREQSRQDQQGVNAVTLMGDRITRAVSLLNTKYAMAKEAVAMGGDLDNKNKSLDEELRKLLADKQRIKLGVNQSYYDHMIGYGASVAAQQKAMASRNAQVKEDPKDMYNDTARRAVLSAQNPSTVAAWDASAKNAPLVEPALEQALARAAGSAPTYRYEGEGSGDKFRKDLSEAAFGKNYTGGAISPESLKSIFGASGDEWLQRKVEHSKGGKPLDPSLSAASGGLSLALAADKLGERLALSAVPVSQRPSVLSPEALKAVSDTRATFHKNMVTGLTDNINETLPAVRKKLMDIGFSGITDASTPEKVAEVIARTWPAPADGSDGGVGAIRRLAGGLEGAGYMAMLPNAFGGAGQGVRDATEGYSDPLLQGFTQNVQMRNGLIAAKPEEIAGGASTNPLTHSALDVMNRQMMGTGKLLISSQARMRDLPGVTEAYDYKAVRQQAADPTVQTIANNYMKNGTSMNIVEATNRAMHMQYVTGTLAHNGDVGQLRQWEAMDPINVGLALSRFMPDEFTEQQTSAFTDLSQRMVEAQYAGDPAVIAALKQEGKDTLREHRLQMAYNKFGERYGGPNPLTASAVRVAQMNPANRTPDDKLVEDQVLNQYGWTAFLDANDLTRIEELLPDAWDRPALAAIETRINNINTAKGWNDQAKQSIGPINLDPPKWEDFPEEMINAADKAAPGAGKFLNADLRTTIETLQKGLPQYSGSNQLDTLSAPALPAQSPAGSVAAPQALPARQPTMSTAGGRPSTIPPVPAPSPVIGPPAPGEEDNI